MAAVGKRDLVLNLSATKDQFSRAMKSAAAELVAFDGNVEKMTTSVNSALSRLGETAENPAKAITASFNRAFRQVQDQARELTAAGGSTGGLDLASSQAAVASAERQATYLRAVADAANRANVAQAGENAELRVYAVAASTAAAEAEHYADALRRQGSALELVGAEMNAAGAAGVRLAAGHRTATVSSGQMRAASQQLSYQISDVGTSFAGGISPMVIFAQQGSQVIQAITLMQGEAKGLIGFLGGPWGAVILGAISIVGVFASKMDLAGDSATKKKTALEALTEAVKALDSATGHAVNTEQQDIASKVNATRASLAKALATRTELAAELGRLSLAPVGGRAANQGLGGVYEMDAVVVGKKIAENDKAIADAHRAIRQADVPGIMSHIADRTDAATAATHKYERSVGDLYKRYSDGKISRTAYETGALSATKERDTALDLIREKEAAGKRAASSVRSAERAAAREAETELKKQIKLLDDIRISSEGVLASIRLPTKASVNQRANQTDEDLGIDPAGELRRLIDGSEGRKDEAYARANDGLTAAKSPIADYKAQIRENVGDMGEAMEGVAVRGLGALEDGLTGLITGTESVASAFKKMATSILADMARLAVERAILGAIDAGAGGGGFFSKLLGHADGGEIRGFAAGGHVSGPGGPRSDSILSWLSDGEFVVNAASAQRFLPLLHAINQDRLPGFADGGMVGGLSSLRASDLSPADMREVTAHRDQRMQLDANVNVSTNTPLLHATMEQVSLRTIGMAADPIMAGAEARTRKAIGKIALPGGYG